MKGRRGRDGGEEGGGMKRRRGRERRKCKCEFGGNMFPACAFSVARASSQSGQRGRPALSSIH